MGRETPVKFSTRSTHTGLRLDAIVILYGEKARAAMTQEARSKLQRRGMFSKLIRHALLSAPGLFVALLALSAQSAADTGWVQWSVSQGGNGHWYKVVSHSSGISWSNGNIAANAEGGYLATTTSASENDFVFSLVDAPVFWVDFQAGAFGPWIGLLQQDGAAEPTGGWSWGTGESFAYSNWSLGEPNDGNGSQENRGHFHALANGVRSPTWNDLSDSWLMNPRGYVVERESNPLVWSPQGRIFFSAQGDAPQGGGIYSVNPDGSNLYRHVNFAPSYWNSFFISPDKTKIYTSSQGDPDFTWREWPILGGTHVNRTWSQFGAVRGATHLTPSGKIVGIGGVFASTSGLAVLDLSTNTVVVQAGSPGNEWGTAVLSENAVLTGSQGSGTTLYRTNLASGTGNYISTGLFGNWPMSYDSISDFVYVRGQSNNGSPLMIYRIRPDGTGFQWLTTPAETNTAESPTVSPDSQSVAYADKTSGQFWQTGLYRLMVMDSNGANKRSILEGTDLFGTGFTQHSPVIWVGAPIFRVLLNTTTVVGGVLTSGMVKFDQNSALPRSVRMTDNSSAILMSSYCTVPANQLGATFNIYTYGVSLNTVTTISAYFNGITRTANLTLTPAKLDLLRLSPPYATAGNHTIGIVYLNGRAPSTGAKVNLYSTNPAVASSASSVTVAYGASYQKFPVSTFGVDVVTNVVISASRAGITRTASLSVRPAILTSLTLPTISTVGGTSVTATVSMNGKAGPSGRTVLLTSNRSSIVVPASMYLPPQKASWNFTVNTLPVTTSTTGTIIATQGSNTASVTLTVTP